MAKISPSSIKYSVIADFASEGPVEKPDVIGALFGQTEGLLGTDMELRELQKEGKIGRIDVNLTTENGKTKGEIIIPSALDKTETTIIAASLETIDKIGPTDAKITIKEIEDVRGSKRDYIMERAKQLLGNIKGAGLESQEIEQELRESARVSKVRDYGDENLPAGPDIEESKEIIVVEGRADVVNLLKHGIKNAIGMDGTKLPKEIAKLGETKELIVFTDGDRGGKLIAKNVQDNASVTYITSAPDGKEVEELTGKEIYQALRKKVPVEKFFKKEKAKGGEKSPQSIQKSAKNLTKTDKEKLKQLVEQIKGKNVLVLNENLETIKDVPASKIPYLRTNESVLALVTNTATRTLVLNAEKEGIKYVAAKNFGRIEDTDVELISL